MSGRLVGIVGPSGVGKDSIMAGLAKAHEGLSLVKRTITRAPELGGEVYHSVNEDEFDDLVANNAFCLHWRAHDLRYGIPVSVVEGVLNGQQLLVNLSRSVLLDAEQTFERFEVLNITASENTVRNRLLARGRETETEIERRLTRLNFPLPPGINPIVIENNGSLEEAVDAALNALQLANA